MDSLDLLKRPESETREIVGDLSSPDAFRILDNREQHGYSIKDCESDLIFVNAGNNLKNLKAADAWKVLLVGEEFHRLMFQPAGP